MNNIVWSPTEESMRQSNMYAFMHALNTRYALNLNTYDALHQWSIENKALFWENVWKECGVIATQSYTKVLEQVGAFPGYTWFKDSTLNFCENLLRHAAGFSDKTAITFYNELGVTQHINYRQLREQVGKLSNSLRELGITKGDRIAAYLPNLPQTVIAMLATTSLGAIWSSCSPDFGVQGVVDRFGQIEPKLMFACNGYYYKGKAIDISSNVCNVVEQLPSIKHVIVVDYIQQSFVCDAGELLFYDALMQAQPNTTIRYESVEFTHPLYIMYSSGTTGVPKCIVHGTGGTLLQHLKEHMLHTDIKPLDKLFYFTTCGWMMWNWQVSALACGATIMLYDGSPTHPSNTVLWNYAQQENITVFGTSAKYLSAIEKADVDLRQTHNLKDLRCILSTGSPLLPESYDYIISHIKPAIQIASISGGTDIISCFALGNPLLPVYSGELQCKGLGMDVDVVDERGISISQQKGELICRPPFPSMPVCFWHDGDFAKYKAAYFEKFPGVWAHGDYAQLTTHNGLIIHGRSDATLNPGGIRIGTAEIYRQVEKLPEIIESIAVGQEWYGDTRIVLFIKLAPHGVLNSELKAKIKKVIRDNTTPRHVPAIILEVADIPRTRSGKIVELAVTQAIHGRPIKNTEALANAEALEYFKHRKELQG